MANSSSISLIKNKIIKELINDELIVKVIDSNTVALNRPEDLIGTHIFDYNQNPETINTAQTFLTIQLHIPFIREQKGNKIMVQPTLEIWIISHEKHMYINNIPKVVSNRNDYLSQLIDEKINGKSGYGIGKLELVSNIEGAYQQNYLYRKMVFQCKDLNDSLCDEE